MVPKLRELFVPSICPDLLSLNKAQLSFVVFFVLSTKGGAAEKRKRTTALIFSLTFWSEEKCFEKRKQPEIIH